MIKFLDDLVAALFAMNYLRQIKRNGRSLAQSRSENLVVLLFALHASNVAMFAVNWLPRHEETLFVAFLLGGAGGFFLCRRVLPWPDKRLVEVYRRLRMLVIGFMVATFLLTIGAIVYLKTTRERELEERLSLVQASVLFDGNSRL